MPSLTADKNLVQFIGVVSCEEESSLELQKVAISYKQKFPNQLH